MELSTAASFMPQWPSQCKEEEYFHSKLAEIIQEQGNAMLKLFLKYNIEHWKHPILENMIDIATCRSTVRNKIALKESCVQTLQILYNFAHKNKDTFDFLYEHCKVLRSLLYDFYTLKYMNNIDNSKLVIESTFECIEYMLDCTSVDIQKIGCREITGNDKKKKKKNKKKSSDEDNEDEEDNQTDNIASPLLFVVSPMEIDQSVYKSIQEINIYRKLYEIKLKDFLLSEFKDQEWCIDCYIHILCHYVWGGEYTFHFDPLEYNQRTGTYL